ncbi:MAG: hypothetical protein ACE364_05365 [Chlorobiota bacterium]
MKILSYFLLLLTSIYTLSTKDFTHYHDLRKEIACSLTLNYFHLSSSCEDSEYNNVAILDPTCLYNLELRRINDKIIISNIEYELFTYDFNFTFSCSSNNWTDTLNHDLFTDTLETYKSSFEYYSAVNNLHLNGLIGYDSKGNRLRSISGTSMVSNIELQLKKDLDSVSILRLINLKYYNYIPQDINIDLKNLSFNFNSKAINRRIIGNIFFNKHYQYYYLKLTNGVLIGL